MKGIVRAPVALLFTIASGWLVLFAYSFLSEEIYSAILGVVVVAAAMALVVGVINLFSVHVSKVRRGDKPLYSVILAVSLVFTFSLTLYGGPNSDLSTWLFENIQLPVETSLMAVMAVTLTYACARLLSLRPNLYSIIFVVVVLLMLIGTTPVFGLQFSVVRDNILPWVAGVLAGAGARGILIAVSLGIITTGLRVLLGADRPFGG